jgi:putative two-component system response regulator
MSAATSDPGIESLSETLKGLVQDRPQLEIIIRLCSEIESREEESGLHILRLIAFSVEIGKSLNLSSRQLRSLVLASPLHDIGKFFIPERILLKPGKLDDFEWGIIKQHTVLGHNMLSGSKYQDLQDAAEVVLSHHEKWDGSGYPSGLTEESIPLLARIVSLADVFDALLSKRSYKTSYPVDTSLEIIRETSGSHFDPSVVDAFFSRREAVVRIVKTLNPGGPRVPDFKITEFLEGRR